MIYERNLGRKYLVLCMFTFPGGHGIDNNSGIMISVNSPQEIQSEFELVTKNFNYKNAKLISFVPHSNSLFKAKQPEFIW